MKKEKKKRTANQEDQEENMGDSSLYQCSSGPRFIPVLPWNGLRGRPDGCQTGRRLACLVRILLEPRGQGTKQPLQRKSSSFSVPCPGRFVLLIYLPLLRIVIWRCSALSRGFRLVAGFAGGGGGVGHRLTRTVSQCGGARGQPARRRRIAGTTTATNGISGQKSLNVKETFFFLRG